MKRRTLPCTAAAGLLIATMAVGTAHATGPGGWDHVGHGASASTPSLDGTVYALNTDKPGSLFVGGSFTGAGGVAATNRIARWNGTAWSAVSPTSITNGVIYALAYDATTGKLYAGGTFTDAGGNGNADFIAVSDGTGWAPVCRNGSVPLVTADVTALQIIGRTLYVGGGFADGGGLSSADRLVACNMDTGAVSSTIANPVNEFNGVGVYSLAADSNGVLYAAGGFQNLDGLPAADHVAYLDGTGWHAMGSGAGSCGCAVNDIARKVAVVGTNVYLGTDSKDVGGVALADNVARWDGSAWSAVGSNTAGTDGWFPTGTSITGITSSGANLYATGVFVNANGTATADEIAVFDGSSWHPIGSNGSGDGPLDARGSTTVIWNNRLYVGGYFSTAGGDVLARGLAAYPGYVPVCTNISVQHATGGQPVHIKLSCTDKNGLAVHYGHLSSPLHGALSHLTDGGKVDYTPDVGHVGSDHFTYQGRNADGQSALATVSINDETAGYSNAGRAVAVRASSMQASTAGAVKVKIRNNNTFALHATSLRVVSASKGTFINRHLSEKARSAKLVVLSGHVKASKLSLLKRLNHVRVSVTITFSGPHGSHSKAIGKGVLRAPK